MAETRELLLEIGTEELPPKALLRLAEALAERLQLALSEAGLAPGETRIYAAPRRLATHFTAVPVQQAARQVERRGPAYKAAFDANGQATKAALGFAASCGVEISALETLETDKGSWLVYRHQEAGRKTEDLLLDFVQQAIAELPIPKRMRWADGDAEFVRPVHWVVLLFGNQVVTGKILGVATDRQTYGHRFHAPQALTLDKPGDYLEVLRRQGHVIADFVARREIIKTQVEACARKLGGTAVLNPELLDEVTALVEWPVALSGHFDAEFLRVPPEALISTMQGHQKYFPVIDAQQKLLPHFITVANIDSRDSDQVRLGNERVIRPRFADAAFFWDQDRKQPLASRAKQLDQVIFHKQLGTLGDKSRRVSALAEYIGAAIGANAQHVARASLLAKCDLMTAMVFEFPELQGVMGRYYATHDAEAAEVAIALEEQYLPRQAGDRLPQTDTGQALALAERLDTLLGIFASGQKPSGVKDPFGLRRAALSICRILIETELPLDLRQLLDYTARQFPPSLQADQACEEAFTFIFERLRAYYLGNEQNLPITPQHFDAVAAERPHQPLDFHRRLLGLVAFTARPEAASLAAANKRIRNILRKSASAGVGPLDANALQEPAERSLNQALDRISNMAAPYLQNGDYTAALNVMADLKAPVDAFFDQVLVMAEDPTLRNNRLALLQRVSHLFTQVADLSLLPGSGESAETAA